MKCYVCAADNWLKTDFHSQSIIQLCQNCGNCCHAIEPHEEIAIKDYYRHDYRKTKIPVPDTITTTNNKRGYVGAFLKDFMQDKKNLIVGDVGAATGYLCRWFTDLGHKAYGSEWTLLYRRFSEHFYNIPLAEELDTKHRYDLIIMYHTFEHMIEPDKKLAHYIALLKENGRIFLSTPEWFNVLEEPSGTRWVSFENYYHKDHINVYSKQTLLNMFANAGLEIEKEDHFQYGQTYLLKVGGKKPIVVENVEDKMKILTAQKSATDFFAKKEYDKAIDQFYLFTDAHLENILNIHSKDRDQQSIIFEEILKKFPRNKRILLAYATWLYQGQQYDQALIVFNDLLNFCPVSEIMIYAGWCYAMLKQHKQAINYFTWAMQSNPTKWTEMFMEISKEACELLTWDEVATEALKNELLKAHMEKVGV